MCQWKFLVLRYSANTSERSSVNAAEISRAAVSERVVGVVSDIFCNMWVTSSIIGRVTSIAQADGDLVRADRTAYRSSSFSDVSIKKLFSLPGSSQERCDRNSCEAAEIRRTVLSPGPAAVIDMR